MTATDPAASELSNHLRETVRVLQIIVAALVVSCALLTIIAAVFLSVPEGDAARDAPQTLAYVALGGVVMAMVAAAAVSRSIGTAGRRRLLSSNQRPARPNRRVPWQQAEFQTRFGDQARLSGVYVTRTIVAAAILEGAAYLGLGAFYISRNPLALAATLAALAGIVATFPTLARVEGWITEQQRRVDEDRSLQGQAVSF